MIITFNPFNQPPVGGSVVAQLIGKPVYPRSTVIRFIKYGTYRIHEVENQDSLVPIYTLISVERYPGSPLTVPAGVVLYVDEEDLTAGTLVYNPTIFLDFRGPDYQSVSLAGNITFATQKHAPGRAIVVRARNTSGVTARNLTFPPSWIFLGPSGKPSTIAPSRTGILSITSFGTSDADVIAAWAVQA